ncbi:MAG: OsmC family protein [Stellaceae bacterium]
MDANDLRALQAPLKKQYRAQPETARIPAHAEAVLNLEQVACRVRSWSGETNAGLHPATGGDGSFACSADMLLEALVACAGVTMSAVASAMGVKLRGGRVIAEGWWDARGTLGVDREAPVGLTDIALKFELDTDADAGTVQRLVEMSERFCVIYQTLCTPPRLSVAHRIVPGG